MTTSDTSSSNKEHNPCLFVISGPSGVGKGSLCRQLFSNADWPLALSVSATSRPMRPGEVDGRDYFFKTPETFAAMIAENAFLEWAQYNQNYYGTPKDFVNLHLEQGNSVLLEIDTQGALMVKDQAPESCLIFVAPPSMEELHRRLAGRGTNDPEDIQRRLKIAEVEMALQPKFDHSIINDEFDRCLEHLMQTMYVRLAKANALG